jgi:hypothetical protein
MWYIIQIFNFLSSVAGVTDLPSATNALVTGINLIDDWEDKIPDDSGNLIDKKYLINKIQLSVATGLGDYKADFMTDELTGDFVLDARLPQYLMEEKQLDDTLADYRTLAFAHTGEELEQMYKNFTDALAARNNDIVTYNSVIQTITSQDQQVTKLQDMRRIADKPVIIDEGKQDSPHDGNPSQPSTLDLEQMTGYVRLLFENARARVMR